MSKCIDNRRHAPYLFPVKLEWSEEKNDVLKMERNLCFEDVVAAIDAGRLLAVYAHPNPEKYPGQFMMVVEIDGYACRIPFVWKDKETAFLKTIYPSRKETKRWEGK
jgi:hypothetical protein